MAFTYQDIGRTFHKCILHISVMAGWIVRDAFHTVLCLYCCVKDRTEYKAYWLMSVPIIDP